MKEINDIKELTYDYIEEYVAAKGKDDIEWLVSHLDKEVKPDKKGNKRRISFIELRKEFILKYIPELMPEKKPKEPTMYERMEALRAKLK